MRIRLPPISRACAPGFLRWRAIGRPASARKIVGVEQDPVSARPVVDCSRIASNTDFSSYLCGRLFQRLQSSRSERLVDSCGVFAAGLAHARGSRRRCRRLVQRPFDDFAAMDTRLSLSGPAAAKSGPCRRPSRRAPRRCVENRVAFSERRPRAEELLRNVTEVLDDVPHVLPAFCRASSSAAIWATPVPPKVRRWCRFQFGHCFQQRLDIDHGGIVNLESVQAARAMSSFSRNASESMPVIASMRRTPAEMLLSAGNMEQPDLPVEDTWVPPQSSFDRAHGDHPHLVAVFFAEERHGALFFCFVLGS